MSNQVGDYFKFLMPFQHVRTLTCIFKRREDFFSNFVAFSQYLNFTESFEEEDIFDKISQNHQQKSFRSNGILNYKVKVPLNSDKIKITAKLETGDYGQIQRCHLCAQVLN